MAKTIHDENIKDREYTYAVEKKIQAVQDYLLETKEGLKGTKDHYPDMGMGEDIAPTIVGLEKIIREQKKKFDRALLSLEVNLKDDLSRTNDKIDDNLKNVLSKL